MNLSCTEMRMLVPDPSSLFPVVGWRLSFFILWSLAMLWSPPVPAFSGLLPDFPLLLWLFSFFVWLSSSVCLLTVWVSYYSILFCDRIPIYTSSLCITTTCMWATDLKPTYLTTLLLSPHGCVRSTSKMNTSKSEFVTSSPDLILFQCFIFQCANPPFVQLETQDSSMIPPPLLPPPLLIHFQVLLVFTFASLPTTFIPISLPWSFPVASSLLCLYLCLLLSNLFCTL